MLVSTESFRDFNVPITIVSPACCECDAEVKPRAAQGHGIGC